jgi:hypothetical protein
MRIAIATSACPFTEVRAVPVGLVVIQGPFLRTEVRIDELAYQGQRPMIPLARDGEPVAKEKRGSNADSRPIATIRTKPTAIGDHLAATGCAHIGEDGELDSLRTRMLEHRMGAIEHRFRPIVAVLVEHARVPVEHVVTVAIVDIGHGTRCSDGVILWAVWDRA